MSQAKSDLFKIFSEHEGFTKYIQNLLDITKIKHLWKDENIIHISKLFDDCFEALKNNQNEMVIGYKAAIELFLGSRDEEFKKIITNT